MDLYEVTEAYVAYMKKFEPDKILSNADEKNTRKFIGLIVKKDKYNYVVPLSSPKYGLKNQEHISRFLRFVSF